LRRGFDNGDVSLKVVWRPARVNLPVEGLQYGAEESGKVVERTMKRFDVDMLDHVVRTERSATFPLRSKALCERTCARRTS
jgi:hypothetical protein